MKKEVRCKEHFMKIFLYAFFLFHCFVVAVAVMQKI